MYTFVLALHVVLAVILVGLVLLQQGKGADIGAVMGGGANSLFGVGGASSLLVRTTTLIAICFMLTSVLLVRLAVTGGSVTGSRTDITEGLNLEALGVKPTDSETVSPQATVDASGASAVNALSGQEKANQEAPLTDAASSTPVENAAAL